MDCVVNEVVLSQRVVSVVVLRVIVSSPDDNASKISMMRSGRVKLVPVFREVEMNYADCLRMRNEIRMCLGYN